MHTRRKPIRPACSRSTPNYVLGITVLSIITIFLFVEMCVLVLGELAPVLAAGPIAPPPIKQPRGLLPGRTVTPASRCSDSLSPPRAVPNPFRGATPVSKNSTTERVYSWAIGPQPATPLQRGDFSGVPRCPRADRPRAAWGHNLDRGPAPVFSWGRPPPGALPRCIPTGRNHSRALGPLPHFRSRGGTRPGSPAAPLRLPSRRVGSRPYARPRLWPRAQASGPRARQRADFAPRHSPGSPRGPTLARSLPPAQPLRSDLDRPGEVALSNVFSPAPPEREIQACAISGSLATPPRFLVQLVCSSRI
ncbi:hypothetical protein NDU88_001235 [Pleurodeles waltl]|uniref:Uncharacterized protein n=1 Tax=Pleurodeles waltl TaxID=8319 RepID=A0AAV7V783_PLEWA|nr:hypothetical protein NDU88_001235 [Pleurodeles waltl]